ncbi:glycoside hydrolase family 76 protein [Moniliophthora roreri MCA 2997]|uniref:Glycoside hydrolase family 76 protein n=1 Tax=Moniliophthora roreri (strain MCA 2997) TaxID=1381753 RepID=V2WRA5_MONRO|nr:glycoside hydrolase family 76 protein [Moniliophthora roreri MCA 2997]
MIIVLSLIYFLTSGFQPSRAQDFTPDPAWKKPDITTSPEERIAIAKDAIETTISIMVDGNGQLRFEDGNYGAVGRFFSEMAEFDMVTNQTIYKDQLLKFFAQAETFRPGFMQGKCCQFLFVLSVHSLMAMTGDITLEQMNWGLAHSIAATHAYTAYSDRKFLDWAELAWSGGRSYTLSEDELQSGKVFGKNVTVRPICGDLTMVGGTFWINDPNSGFVNTLATGSYLIATSLLAEATRNQTYIDSATETEKFYFNHLRNAQGVLLDGIDADTCAPKDEAFAANAGVMIEGLAVLASVMQSDTIVQHLLEVVNKTVSHREWHSVDGIIAADSTTQANAELVSQYVVRGEYLGIQYNAVLDNTRGPGTNVYAASWTGPPSSKFSFDNQTNALSMLIAAIPIRNDTLDITSGGPNTPTTGGDRTPFNARAIVGGVVGGLAFVALLLILVLYLIRRRRAKRVLTNTRNDDQNVSENRTYQVQQPFNLIPEKFRRQQRPAPRTSWSGTRNTTTLSGFSGTLSFTDPSSTLGPQTLKFGSMVPTTELVKVLNERLQPGKWREDEVPPDYASHRS